MTSVLLSLIAGATLGLVVAALMFAAKKNSDDGDGIVDRGRLDYLERTNNFLLYNATMKIWAVTDTQDRFIGAGDTPRAAIDKARQFEQAEMQVPA